MRAKDCARASSYGLWLTVVGAPLLAVLRKGAGANAEMAPTCGEVSYGNMAFCRGWCGCTWCCGGGGGVAMCTGG